MSWSGETCIFKMQRLCLKSVLHEPHAAHYLQANASTLPVSLHLVDATSHVQSAPAWHTDFNHVRSAACCITALVSTNIVGAYAIVDVVPVILQHSMPRVPATTWQF